jgi:hypothetical protein
MAIFSQSDAGCAFRKVAVSGSIALQVSTGLSGGLRCS